MRARTICCWWRRTRRVWARLLKWEHSPSRGEDFPHLYGVLLTSAVLWVKPIAKDAQGGFIIPE